MTKSLPPKSLVLYADDDYEDLDLVREAFNKYADNVELINFRDGIQLLDFIKQLQPGKPLPCLIILDINMPRKNGKEVLRDLRRMEGFEEVPVVLFSTSTLPSEFAFAKSFGAGFITKPLYTEQIAHLVDEMIEHCPEEVRKHVRERATAEDAKKLFSRITFKTAFTF